MSARKTRSPFAFGATVGAAALAAFAVAAVALKRRAHHARGPAGGRRALDALRLSTARLQTLDPEDFYDLCKAYYHSRQFRLRSVRVRGDARDASLYFGTLPYPVAVVRILGAPSAQIDEGAIRDLADVMSLRGVAKGIVHATGGYTDAAIVFACANRIRLVSGDDFLRNISGMPEGARAAMSSMLASQRPSQPLGADAALH